MSAPAAKRSLKGTWPQALLSFFIPILLILSVRWALFEPYVIPSGSMIPNLLIHDHILVSKWSYGLRWPFSDSWIVRWSEPKRGDIVVFRYPQNPELFYVKRLIGLPGDHVRVFSSRLEVNGQVLETPGDAPELNVGGYLNLERSDGEAYVVRWLNPPHEAEPDETPRFETTVEEGRYLFMGDNRDESSDGRSWGTVPEANLIGPARVIWLSCESMLESSAFVCDPATIRWDRLFRSL